MTADPVLVGFFCFAAGLYAGGALAAFVVGPRRADPSARIDLRTPAERRLVEGETDRRGLGGAGVARYEDWDWRWGFITLLVGAVFWLALVLVVTLAKK